ncbi:MAG: PhzF family phenazine biosynthesis protein [Bacteroidota bacterium]
MTLTLYQLDAFTDKLFGGNPAAVVPLDAWIDDKLMQDIAMENNLADTAFFVRDGDEFAVRWFTPVMEINLCGHATLASSYVLYNILGYTKPTITYNSKSGKLVVEKKEDMFLMDFPSWKPEKINEYPSVLLEALGIDEVVAVHKYRDLLVELNKEEDVKNIRPDFTLLKKMGEKVIITAPGRKVDFVSRFFAPIAGIDEDPVTGSAHSQLIPFWSEKLGKKIMYAKQLSQRGGDIYCEQNGQRVVLGGTCIFYMKGEIEV